MTITLTFLYVLPCIEKIRSVNYAHVNSNEMLKKPLDIYNIKPLFECHCYILGAKLHEYDAK